jgi:hydrogenase nickel incorporation protein HypA/HybF
MHELALAEGVIGIVLDEARAAGARRVRAITLTLGALSHVDPAALRQGVEIAGAGTIAEGADLAIVTPPGEAWCMDCLGPVEIARRGDPCPGCGGHKLMVTGGDGMQVTELEVE